jgi:hypothetical protein
MERDEGRSRQAGDHDQNGRQVAGGVGATVGEQQCGDEGEIADRQRDDDPSPGGGDAGAVTVEHRDQRPPRADPAGEDDQVVHADDDERTTECESGHRPRRPSPAPIVVHRPAGELDHDDGGGDDDGGEEATDAVEVPESHTGII